MALSDIRLIEQIQNLIEDAGIGKFQTLASAGWDGTLPVATLTPPVSFTLEDGVTNLTTTFITQTHTSTGAVADNFGIRNLWQLESDNGATQDVFAMDVIWSDANVATGLDADVVFKHMVAGNAIAEKFRFQSDSRLYIQSSDAAGYAGVRVMTPNREYFMGVNTASANFAIVDNTAGGVNRFWIDSSGNTFIGSLGVADSLLHVWKATAGTVTAHGDSLLTLESDTSSAISFLVPNTASSVIVFGDADNNVVTSFGYNHLLTRFWFKIETGDRLYYSANTFQFQENTTISSTGSLSLTTPIISSLYQASGGGLLTIPASGGVDTFCLLSATQELDNKTLDSSVAKGTWTASGTWTIPAVTLGGTLTGGANLISGSNFDINGGDISSSTISGGLTWLAAQNFNSQILTNVNIDSGTVDLITSLTVANAIDIGSYDIRALSGTFDIATGTQPLSITSVTVVTNLNADLIDGFHFSGTCTQSVTAKTIDTIYTNGSKVRIATVSIRLQTGTTGYGYIEVRSDAGATPTTVIAQLRSEYFTTSDHFSAVTFIIIPNNKYRISNTSTGDGSVTILYWTESDLY